MKLKITLILAFFAIIIFSTGCKKDENSSLRNKKTELLSASALGGTSMTTGVTPQSILPLTVSGKYDVTLESVTPNEGGTYTWTWSVQNPNPGNGDGTTVQNLSHWDITLGTCININDVVSAATSTDGNNYIPFTKSWEQDPSILNKCGVDTKEVLKFDVGTSGTAKTFYQLTINKNVEIDKAVPGFYKSGTNTKCGTLTFPGFGCEKICDVSATSTAENILCYGGVGTMTAVVAGGTAPFNYVISGPIVNTTGAESGTFTNLSAGEYTVTVTDSKNCTTTTTKTITQPDLLVASSSATEILCHGGTSIITVSASGGTAPYTGTQNFSVSAGTYSYTVTDANGCSASTSIIITQPDVLLPNIVGTNICSSGGVVTGGSVSAIPTGGTAPYSYLWSNNQTTKTISGLLAGTYNVTVTDANGCTVSGSYTVIQTLGAGGGKTKGFWGNKNGQALITDAFIVKLNTLNLKNANGTPFVMSGALSSTKTTLNNWLQASTATNMAYMLSAQLAATQMNTMVVGFVNENSLIYAPGTNSGNGNPFGMASVKSIIEEAKLLLSVDGNILSGHPLRARAEALKNALDNSNNNLNFLLTCP